MIFYCKNHTKLDNISDCRKISGYKKAQEKNSCFCFLHLRSVFGKGDILFLRDIKSAGADQKTFCHFRPHDDIRRAGSQQHSMRAVREDMKTARDFFLIQCFCHEDTVLPRDSLILRSMPEKSRRRFFRDPFFERIPLPAFLEAFAQQIFSRSHVWKNRKGNDRITEYQGIRAHFL